jgi:hypothetical protein
LATHAWTKDRFRMTLIEENVKNGSALRSAFVSGRLLISGVSPEFLRFPNTESFVQKTTEGTSAVATARARDPSVCEAWMKAARISLS